ncbi:unnamed protein product, partial [Pelagomonas calceolata]
FYLSGRLRASAWSAVSRDSSRCARWRPVSGPSFAGAAPPCDQPLPTKEPLRSPATVPVERGAIAAASSEGRAGGGGGCGPSGVFRCTGLFERRRFCLFISFFIRFFSFLRRFFSLRSRRASLSSLLEDDDESLRRRRPISY